MSFELKKDNSFVRKMAREFEVELKKCPFCGGEAKMKYNVNKYYWAVCSECSVETDGSYSKIEAIKQWNRRANDEI